MGSDKPANPQRQIEPQQNWLARLFNVKPATRYLCFTMSCRRTRQELAFCLKEWRPYGVQGIQVDKERNIIFAGIGRHNRKYSPRPTCSAILGTFARTRRVLANGLVHRLEAQAG